MAKKPRREAKDTDYVDNKELRNLVIYWIENNPNEDGSFLEKFEKTMTTKGKIDKVSEWIKHRRALYSIKKQDTPEFHVKENKLFNQIYKIIKGRVNCFQFNQEEKEDLIQEIMLTEVKYLNRYNELTETSAFSYITAICNNAIKLYLGNDNESRFCRLPWNTLSDDHIATMYGTDDKEETE